MIDNSYGYEVSVIADSINDYGNRLTTFQLKYPRMIHAEVMTHRVFSRNAASTRAIPTAKKAARVLRDPATPVCWGSNKPGMQADSELTGIRKALAKAAWRTGSFAAAGTAWTLSKIGVHKQIAGRPLEPFESIHVIITATDFDNWFNLRLHADAQPEIYELAALMRREMTSSDPRHLKQGKWHLPYIVPTLDSIHATSGVTDLIQFSAARCARVSYTNHDNSNPSPAKDRRLAHTLYTSGHMSPFEHQAKPKKNAPGNFTGWEQARHNKMVADLFSYY